MKLLEHLYIILRNCIILIFQIILCLFIIFLTWYLKEYFEIFEKISYYEVMCLIALSVCFFVQLFVKPIPDSFRDSLNLSIFIGYIAAIMTFLFFRGPLGLYGGFIVGFFFTRFLVDIYKNTFKGFLYRTRRDILKLIFLIIGLIIGEILSIISDPLLHLILPDSIFPLPWPFMGIIFGIGIWGKITALEWEDFWKEGDIQGEEKDEKSIIETKVHYLLVLFQLFKISNTDIDLCRSSYLSIYERVLPMSDTTKKIIRPFDNLLEDFQNNSEIYNCNDLPQILSSISKDMQISLLRDYLSCIYSANKVSQAQKDLGKEICNHYGQFHDILELYDRSNTKPKTGKFYDALKILGLTPSATQEEIGSAYRNLIKQFHPDRLLNVSEPIREFAKQKTIEINAAYEFLRDHEQFEDEEMVLVFLDTDSDRLFLPKANATFICRCRLCLEKNRIQAGQDRKAARCRKCHALLGEER